MSEWWQKDMESMNSFLDVTRRKQLHQNKDVRLHTLTKKAAGVGKAASPQKPRVPPKYSESEIEQQYGRDLGTLFEDELNLNIRIDELERDKRTAMDIEKTLKKGDRATKQIRRAQRGELPTAEPFRGLSEDISVNTNLPVSKGKEYLHIDHQAAQSRFVVPDDDQPGSAPPRNTEMRKKIYSFIDDEINVDFYDYANDLEFYKLNATKATTFKLLDEETEEYVVAQMNKMISNYNNKCEIEKNQEMFAERYRRKVAAEELLFNQDKRVERVIRSAIMIQSAWRGHLGRVLAREKAHEREQKILSENANHYLYNLHSIIKIQSLARGRAAREYFKFWLPVMRGLEVVRYSCLAFWDLCDEEQSHREGVLQAERVVRDAIAGLFSIEYGRQYRKEIVRIALEREAEYRRLLMESEWEIRRSIKALEFKGCITARAINWVQSAKLERANFEKTETFARDQIAEKYRDDVYRIHLEIEKNIRSIEFKKHVHFTAINWEEKVIKLSKELFDDFMDGRLLISRKFKSELFEMQDRLEEKYRTTLRNIEIKEGDSRRDMIVSYERQFQMLSFARQAEGELILQRQEYVRQRILELEAKRLRSALVIQRFWKICRAKVVTRRQRKVYRSKAEVLRIKSNIEEMLIEESLRRDAIDLKEFAERMKFTPLEILSDVLMAESQECRKGVSEQEAVARVHIELEANKCFEYARAAMWRRKERHALDLYNKTHAKAQPVKFIASNPHLRKINTENRELKEEKLYREKKQDSNDVFKSKLSFIQSVAPDTVLKSPSWALGTPLTGHLEITTGSFMTSSVDIVESFDPNEYFQQSAEELMWLTKRRREWEENMDHSRDTLIWQKRGMSLEEEDTSSRHSTSFDFVYLQPPISTHSYPRPEVPSHLPKAKLQSLYPVMPGLVHKSEQSPMLFGIAGSPFKGRSLHAADSIQPPIYGNISADMIQSHSDDGSNMTPRARELLQSGVAPIREKRQFSKGPLKSYKSRFQLEPLQDTLDLGYRHY